MSDIMDRLRQMADLFEAQHAPHNMVLHLRAAADEIERLRERLEVSPDHPYDGIYARDETIRLQEAEISRLRAGGCARDQGLTQYCAEAAAMAEENERLRAALEMFACDCAVHERCAVPDNCRNFQARRAALKEPRT